MVVSTQDFISRRMGLNFCIINALIRTTFLIETIQLKKKWKCELTLVIAINSSHLDEYESRPPPLSQKNELMP